MTVTATRVPSFRNALRKFPAAQLARKCLPHRPAAFCLPAALMNLDAAGF